MKVTFIGVGSAFSKKNFQSNVLVESGNIKLLIDCGHTAISAIEAYGLSVTDITHIFITHLHADHVGGLCSLAQRYKFRHQYTPKLLSTPTLLDRLWNASLSGSLEFITQDQKASAGYCLEDFFRPFDLSPSQWELIEEREKLSIYLHPTQHVEKMESYALEICEGEPQIAKQIFFSGDTKYDPALLAQCVDRCALLFHDCQLFDSGENNKAGVHVSYNQLLQLPKSTQQKMWLYHYGDSPLPDLKTEAFLGFVQQQQSFVL
ncbi:MBL fold metallo-hydrolase [Deltaproteobacteria bacterium TL4]